MVAASGAKLLQDEAVEVLVGRLLPLATCGDAEPARGLRARRVPYSDDADREELADKIHALGASAVIVTGGHRDRGRGLALRRRAPRSDSGRALRVGRDPRSRMHSLRERCLALGERP